MNCYNCSKPLVADDVSIEHIIPQSIGGRLKSKSLLCVRCNSTFGSSIDKAVEKCYESLIALLALDRERSDRLPVLKNLQTPSGTLYRLVDGKKAEVMHPSVIKTEEGYSITARNEDQLKDIFKGFKKRYPSFDIEEAMQAVTYTDSYLNEPLQISFTIGGDAMLRGVGKIALNQYIRKFGNAPFLEEIINVINGTVPLEQNRIHLVPTNDYAQLEADEVSHTIYLKALPQSNILYAWVNLFSYSSFIVVLSNQYDGPAIEDTFCYDVLLKAQRPKKVIVNYEGPQEYCDKTLSEKAKSEITAAISESITTGMYRVGGIARKKQFYKGLEEMFMESVEEELKERATTNITEEVLDAAHRRFNKKSTEFIAHHLAGGKKRREISDK